CALGSLKYPFCVYFLSAPMTSVVFPPCCIMLVAWHIGPVPPPHSSVNTTFLPSLLKTAVCQRENVVSDTPSRRMGFSGFVMSTRSPYDPHAPASRFISG